MQASDAAKGAAARKGEKGCCKLRVFQLLPVQKLFTCKNIFLSSSLSKSITFWSDFLQTEFVG